MRVTIRFIPVASRFIKNIYLQEVYHYTMRRIVLSLLVLMACVAGAQAYVLILECPDKIPVGMPLFVTGTTTFPAGTSFELVLSQSEYFSTEVATKTVVVEQDKNFSEDFQTTGLPGGQYKVEARLQGDLASKLSSDSVITKIVQLIDRSAEITILSPMSQQLDQALVIQGTLSKTGNSGVQIDVRGPTGRVFGPQYIATTAASGKTEGSFYQKVTVFDKGNYFVSFTDNQGYIGEVTFTVTGPVTSVTSVFTTLTTQPTVATPGTTVTPQTTKSPAPVFSILIALAIAGAISFGFRKLK